MAVISAEPEVEHVTERVRIVVRSGQGAQSGWEERMDRTVRTAAANAWPIEVSITPAGGDPTRVYEISAAAIDLAGEEIARVRAISGFVEDKALQLDLVFDKACLGKVEECDDETQTCRAGVCADAHVDVTLLPPYSGSAELVPPGGDGGNADGGPRPLDAGGSGSGGATGGTGGTGGGDSAVDVDCDGAEVACDQGCANLMIDPDNCGKCGVACRAAPGENATCDAGKCPVVIVPLTSLDRPASALGLDATHVYWGTAYEAGVTFPIPMTQYLGDVLKVSNAGGLPATLASMAWVESLAVADAVYVATREVTSSSNGSFVAAIAIGGGPPTSLMTGSGTLPVPTRVTVADGVVYWAGGNGHVYKRGQSDAAPVQLTGSSISGGARGIGVQGNDVYWLAASSGGSTVWKVPTAGGSASKVADAAPSGTITYGFAVDAANAYWTSSSAGIIWVPLAGGTPEVLASAQADPRAVATDGATVYWINYGTGSNANGSLMSVPVDGGTPIELASGLQQPTAIAIDASAVYWAEREAIKMRSPR